ncbi:MAG: DUF1554 domain-containing protein [Candidatus Thiodiazotropha taylori]|uniref:DUF1554 domain-containing protein n=1 Tax=Candidatus Thiodiazotropha taylori TaxID=2792791 RepID=A0A9E4P4C6_9GAMM|nr:DUF1554 domain-containing protein [Candidatus Thiodiazotropha taylori]MCG8094185.1 DUF1554 domain-containing protein [Candidatus Thiodiazotropha endolucinida]MCG7955984.1 DUF1554 domain-containing protein [Candidatus Thiodiazotropha taylori]MCG8028097.1 DUF1554 domain-containing protein [Candidatus Thiodiazotropha taylori]MCG8107554.1 DUF1554 domain-containing protein [Candidatus Thiodiazotropha taylori]
MDFIKNIFSITMNNQMNINSKALFLLLFFLLNSSLGLADTRVWVTTTTTDGGLGGRAGADTLCATDATNPSLANVRALISIDATDEIQDMPANYGVPTGEVIYQVDGTTQVATDWAHLLSDKNTTNLTNIIEAAWAGVGGIWTFSNFDGSLDPNNCSNGGSSGAGVVGMSGLANTIDNNVFIAGNTTCSLLQVLYCVSWTPDSPPVSGITAIPTMSEWSMALLIVMLGLGALIALKRQY